MSEIPEFHKIVTPGHDGLIVVPEAVKLGGLPKISYMLPSSWRFVAADSVGRDYATDALVIDTGDLVPDRPPTSEEELGSRAAVLRVYRGMGTSAILDGYVVDFRHVQRFPNLDRGLQHGVQSDEFLGNVKEYGTALPLGVMYDVYGETEFHGDPNVIEDARHLMQQVDIYRSRLPRSEQKRSTDRLRIEHGTL